jgi:hypothetical protein
LLRFRNRNSEAYGQIEQALNKHWDANEARRDLMLCLQDIDPASAAHQAFIINCLQNGSTSKIPAGDIQPAAGPAQPAAVKVINNKPQKVVKEANKTVNKVLHKAAGHGQRKNKSAGTHRAEHMPSLLVPPPPLPNWFGFLGGKSSQPASTNAPQGLKAKANSIKKGKAIKSPSDEAGGGESKPEAEASPQRSAKHSSPESDSDFLLDWAAIKKKPGKK